MKLYDDQRRDVAAIRLALRDHKRVLYQLPTGGGKTVVAGYIAQRLRKADRKVLVLVHRKELVGQFLRTLQSVGLADHVGVIAAGYAPIPWAPIQIASVFSLVRRLERVRFDPDIVVTDEAHHVGADTWNRILDAYSRAALLGLSATPSRLDGKGLGRHFAHMVRGLSVAELVALRRLAPSRVLRVPAGFVRKGIRKTGGDYNRGELDKRANAVVVGNSVAAYQRHIPGARAIMFGVTKRHCRETAERFRQAGVAAEYVGDDTPAATRDRVFREFGEGALDVVCNVGLVDEGFDVPECEAVLDAAPTMSIVRYKQRAGRYMRYRPGKTGVLLDIAGNSIHHGLPDADCEWTLDDTKANGRPTSAADRPSGLRSCAECFMVFPATVDACPECGRLHDGRPVVEVDVELVDVTPQKPKPRPPRASKAEIGRVLHLARTCLREGDPAGAWRHIRAAQTEWGYLPQWAHLTADRIGIPHDARR